MAFLVLGDISRDSIREVRMSFPQKVKEDVFVASQRHCCLCHKFCGVKIEIHHIVLASEGGRDTFDNAIALCFDCHADEVV